MSHYGVARMTVRNALQLLELEGLTRAEHSYFLHSSGYRQGTPIADPNPGPGGIYARLEDLDHTLERFTEEVTAGMPTEAEVRLLAMTPGVPVFRLVRTAYDVEGRAVEVCDRDSGERMITNVRGIAGTERPPGSVLVTAAAILLGLLAGGLFVVSLAAQYTYIVTIKHNTAVSLIEAIGLDIRRTGKTEVRRWRGHRAAKRRSSASVWIVVRSSGIGTGTSKVIQSDYRRAR
jgi:hypothetical protein